MTEFEREPTFDLDEMLARMDPSTFPDDIEIGAPVGDEVW